MRTWSIGKSATLIDIGTCINKYRMSTPGLYVCINVGVKLGDQIESPDLIAMINSGPEKQCKPDFEQGYFVGPPNFVLDIHEDIHSSFAQNRKKTFSSAGVKEYLVLNETLTQIEWNRLTAQGYQQILPDGEGLIKSTSLPGFWLSVRDLEKRNFWGVMAWIEQGVTRREHHELMMGVWRKK